MKKYIEDILRNSLTILKKRLPVPDDFVPTVEIPKNYDMADYSSSMAFSLARAVRKSPAEIGKMIIDNLDDREGKIRKVDVVSGYLNFFLKEHVYEDEIKKICENEQECGRIDVGHGRRILLEFVSANPTGPLHVGHGRGAVLGDSLSRILRHAGYYVLNEYYINDAGKQVYSLGRSIASSYFRRFGMEMETGEYQGEYIEKIADELKETYGDGLLSRRDDISFFSDFGVRRILDNIREDLEKINIKIESWISEKELYDKGYVQNLIEKLKSRGYVYSEDGALWFKSREFGDSKDRVLKKAGGEYTYFASDIAYHYEKYHKGFNLLVNIWGADHHGYLPRLKAAMSALGLNPELLHVIFVQMVHLTRDGKPVQMSKRSGEYVTLRELVDEVKSDAARFFFLMRESDSGFNFDIELAKRQSSENPVYYVQYAHARICSIFSEALSRNIPLPDFTRVDISRISSPEEIRLIRYLIHFRDEIERSARTFSVHNITYFLIELANEFHKYYNNHRVLDEKNDVREARMVLLKGIKNTIKSGLDKLGVSAPESM